MSVGDRARMEWGRSADPATGVEIVRLTDGLGDTIVPDCTQIVLDAHGLLLSSNRTGSWQAHVLDLDSKTLTQVTDVPGGIDPRSPTLVPTADAVAYVAGPTVSVVELTTLEARELYTAGRSMTPGAPSATATGSAVTFACHEMLGVGHRRGEPLSRETEMRWRMPTSIVVRVEADGSGGAVLYGERNWITRAHPSPADPDLVVLERGGPELTVERLWGLRVSTLDVWPVVDQKPHLSRCGSELFASDGRLIALWGSRPNADSQVWRWGNLVLSRELRNHSIYTYPSAPPNSLHASPGASMLVGDTCHLETPIRDPDDYISLIHHEQTRAVLRPLCRHGASRSGPLAHPRPVFTPDGRHVLFNSDREGPLNVYMASSAYAPDRV